MVHHVSVIAVDTNVLLDIWRNAPEFAAASRDALQIALSRGEVIVAAIVVAELAAAFSAPEHFVTTPKQMSVGISPSSREELVLAGRLLRERRRAVGNGSSRIF